MFTYFDLQLYVIFIADVLQRLKLQVVKSFGARNYSVPSEPFLRLHEKNKQKIEYHNQIKNSLVWLTFFLSLNFLCQKKKTFCQYNRQIIFVVIVKHKVYLCSSLVRKSRIIPRVLFGISFVLLRLFFTIPPVSVFWRRESNMKAQESLQPTISLSLDDLRRTVRFIRSMNSHRRFSKCLFKIECHRIF